MAQQTDERNIEQVRATVRALMGREGHSQSQVAKQTGLSATAISQFLNDKYKGDTEGVAATLDKWVRGREVADEVTGQMPRPLGFVPTKTGIDITAALTYAHVAGDMVEVYGVPGVGKTFTAGHYRDEHPNVWIATMAPSRATVMMVLEEISVAVDAKVDMRGASAPRVARAIVERLNGTQGLLIIDEAQHLPVDALEEVRSVHDATGVGVALMGSKELHDHLNGNSRSPHLAQLFSRIGMPVKIDKPKAADVDAILDAWGITDKDARSQAHAVSRKPGALRAVTKTMRLAVMAAGGDGSAVNVDQVKAAWSRLNAWR